MSLKLHILSRKRFALKSTMRHIAGLLFIFLNINFSFLLQSCRNFFRESAFSFFKKVKKFKSCLEPLYSRRMLPNSSSRNRCQWTPVHDLDSYIHVRLTVAAKRFLCNAWFNWAQR
eukprot:gb/GEZJ01005266.1/.p1 GENE.gb/GEZJ01005266.1/~~gb/GEZJ01005266.1/.p1  ORF type:complete len:116 (+),score=2.20 gb/GEZJ01005266.1/:1533-1880(+)